MSLNPGRPLFVQLLGSAHRKPSLVEAVTAVVLVMSPANTGPEVEASSPPHFGSITLELPVISIFK